MIKQVILIGTNHQDYDYLWIREIIKKKAPDCFTLEQSINATGISKFFNQSIEESVKQCKESPSGDNQDLAAVIHYAREHETPVYLVDLPDGECWNTELDLIKLTKELNLNENDNFRIIDTIPSPTCPDDDLDLERRNDFISKLINYHTLTYNKIIHMGGRGHYYPHLLNRDSAVPLQELLIADSIEIIDAVNKSREKYK